jgi:hypothetical protein
VRCLARLKGQDAYFETDLLPVPPNAISRELWSEQIEELVLFDFHFEGRESKKSVTEGARTRGEETFVSAPRSVALPPS